MASIAIGSAVGSRLTSVVVRAETALLGYFIRPGGAYALAICRIFLFFYLYYHVYHGIFLNFVDQDNYYQLVNTSNYMPKSLVWVFSPNDPPPIALVHALIPVALISTIFAIFGFLTRLSMIVSVMSLTFFAGLFYSWEPLWSHPYNSGLLAGIGLMFGRAGDVLSIDSLIARHVWKRPITTNRQVYWWPLILTPRNRFSSSQKPLRKFTSASPISMT